MNNYPDLPTTPAGALDDELAKLADAFAAQATKSVTKDDTGLDMLSILAKAAMLRKHV